MERAGRPSSAERPEVLGAIRNPLVFFALALLVIEAVFAVVVVASGMTATQQFVSFLVMAGLFAGLVAVVAYITLKAPQNLYEDVAKMKTEVQHFNRFIETDAFRDAVLDIVRAEKSSDNPSSLSEPPDDSGTKHGT